MSVVKEKGSQEIFPKSTCMGMDVLLTSVHRHMQCLESKGTLKVESFWIGKKDRQITYVTGVYRQKTCVHRHSAWVEGEPSK